MVLENKNIWMVHFIQANLEMVKGMVMVSLKINQDKIVIGGNIKMDTEMEMGNLVLLINIFIKDNLKTGNSMDLANCSFQIKVLIKVFFNKEDGQKRVPTLTKMEMYLTQVSINKMIHSYSHR